MRLFYDLHIHSCLSPCADDDMTPNNITGLAAMLGLDVIAVSDHNSMLNCGAVIKAGAANGIAVLPAMELETSENVHILMLFPSYGRATEFFEYFAAEKRSGLMNRPDIFGEQIVMDEHDTVVGHEDNLLLTASDVGVYECAELADRFGGVAIPAHVDREANGLIAVLGDVSDDMGFGTLEVSSKADGSFVKRLEARGFMVIRDSDAHYLENINTAGGENVLEVDSPDAQTIINLLKTKKGVNT